MLEEIEVVAPEKIEERSMEIITASMKPERLAFYTEKELKVVKRCIHTSADFDYEDNMIFKNNAVESGMQAILHGACIITDTTMAASGINKKVANEFGASVHCFIGDEKIAKLARERQVTRASVCMEEGARLAKESPVIFAIGNAPTALIRLYELIQNEELRPALVIGAPVGFVNVVESKNLIKRLDVPMIVADKRKGGSNVAAAIVNALLYQCK